MYIPWRNSPRELGGGGGGGCHACSPDRHRGCDLLRFFLVAGQATCYECAAGLGIGVAAKSVPELPDPAVSGFVTQVAGACKAVRMMSATRHENCSVQCAAAKQLVTGSMRRVGQRYRRPGDTWPKHVY